VPSPNRLQLIWCWSKSRSPKGSIKCTYRVEGKKYYKRSYGGVDSDSYKGVSYRKSLAIQNVYQIVAHIESTEYATSIVVFPSIKFVTTTILKATS
jgi:hypothetical protein